VWHSLAPLVVREADPAVPSADEGACPWYPTGRPRLGPTVLKAEVCSCPVRLGRRYRDLGAVYAVVHVFEHEGGCHPAIDPGICRLLVRTRLNVYRAVPTRDSRREPRT
jgi:hypothetical protein